MPHDERELSKTAIWVAAARAIGAREPDPAIRNPDRFAEALLGEPSDLILKHPMIDALSKPYGEAMQDIEIASTVRAMTERTRFIDQALERAGSQQITQCLIVGAGLDSHAYRFQELLSDIRVFEVDRVKTSAFKRRRVEAALGAPPPNLTYVAADLEHETLPDALARHGYDPSRKTFVIMEGVTMYVLEEPLRATFRFFAAHAPGSSVVFDFATQTMADGMKAIDLAKVPETARPSVERWLDLFSHEPWVFGIPLDTEQEFLADVGLQMREMLTIGGEESVRRYLTRGNGTTMGSEAHSKAEILRKRMQEHMMRTLTAEQRAQAEAKMHEQMRQNAYRIAEVVVPGIA
jgi:methyltransferase (TIGR00027 family)